MAGFGRPPVDEPREKKITIRVTDREAEQIEAYAKRHNLSKTQVMLQSFKKVLEAEEQEA